MVRPPLRTALVLCAAAAWAPVASAAAAELQCLPDMGFSFGRSTTADGLPTNSITALATTPDGFLWIGTYDGLARFDGAAFEILDQSRFPSLGSNRITQLQTTSDGSLWVMTEAGTVSRIHAGLLEPVAGFEKPSQARLFVALDDRIAIASETGLVVATASGSVTVAIPDIGRITALAADSAGHLLVGGQTGIIRVIGERAHALDLSSFEEFPVATALGFGQDGEILIGTETGLISWKGIDHPDSPPSQWPLASVQAITSGGDGTTLAKTRRELVAVAGGEVRVLRPVDAGYEPFLEAQLDRTGRHWVMDGRAVMVDGNRVCHTSGDLTLTSLAETHDGILWLGTTSDGLVALRPDRVEAIGEPEGLVGNNVYSLALDRAGRVWIGSRSGGISVWADGTPTTVHHREPGLLARDVGAIFADRAGVMWASLPILGHFEDDRFVPDPLPGLPPEMRVAAFAEDSHQRILLGTNIGLWRRGRDAWTRIELPTDGDQPAIQALLTDPSGTTWVGSRGLGLLRLRGEEIEPVAASELSTNIRSLFLDQDRFLWIGTEDRGLQRLRLEAAVPTASDVVTVGQRQGMFDHVIHAILDDQQGQLWLSGNRGIARVRKADIAALASGTITQVEAVVYDDRDGMRNREANGGGGVAGLEDHLGRMWFASQYGVVVVDPRRLAATARPPLPMILSATLGSRRVELQSPVSLAVAPHERTLSLDYTAPSFRAADRLRFRYQLEGFDPQPVEAGTGRQARYTRVDPGRYTFRVWARSADGVWREAPNPIEVHVRPQPWETIWFTLLLLVLALGVLAALAWRWSRRELRRRGELEAQVQQRTAELVEQRNHADRARAEVSRQAEELRHLDRLKAELFANISHELRTPLTLTLGALEELRTHQHVGDQAGPALELAQANSQRLLSRVEEILALARHEAGRAEVRARHGDIAAYVGHLLQGYWQWSERARVALEIDLPDQPLLAWFDPDILDLAVQNLLSNAFKYTPAGGRVRVSLRADGAVGDGPRELAIEVSDTGPGIDAQFRDLVFERFWRAPAASEQGKPGAGIGLALARDLIRLHGGEITLDPAGAAGASFTIRLPLGKHHLRPEQCSSIELTLGPARTISLAPEGLDASRPADSDVAPVEDDRLTILVIDDHPDIRAFVRRQLEPESRVVEAGDGEQGLQVIRRLVPDLVLCDVVMPRLDGLGVLDAVRRDPTISFVPVILVTALAEHHNVLAGLDRGADDYLVKPFDVRELQHRVTNQIASRRRLAAHLALRFALTTTVAGESPKPTTSSAEQRFAERLVAVIDAGLQDEDFGVEEIARKLAMDRTTLYRRVREVLNDTPSRLLRQRRLARARHLLETAAGTVSEVAYSVGFRSVSHFSQCFRDCYDEPPSATRLVTEAPVGPAP